jgi:hypothetical protein
MAARSKRIKDKRSTWSSYIAVSLLLLLLMVISYL